MNHPCRHCSTPWMSRTGRGLCRTCWNDPAIRAQYPLVAVFGGPVAGAMRFRRRKTMRKLLKEGKMP